MSGRIDDLFISDGLCFEVKLVGESAFIDVTFEMSEAECNRCSSKSNIFESFGFGTAAGFAKAAKLLEITGVVILPGTTLSSLCFCCLSIISSSILIRSSRERRSERADFDVGGRVFSVSEFETGSSFIELMLTRFLIDERRTWLLVELSESMNKLSSSSLFIELDLIALKIKII